MGHLFLALLGSPDVRHAGRPVIFATRKTFALLVYLVVEPGPHARDKLATLFWPESGAAQARTTLRSTLALLRDALGGDGTHLLVSRDVMAFAHDSSYDSDVEELRTAARVARDLGAPSGIAPSQGARMITLLENASLRYRSDFLDGFTLGDALDFDDWAMLRREALHREMVLVFDLLTRLRLDTGAAVEAIDAAGRWIAHDRLNEVAYRRLMEAHAATGDRAAAMRVYEACRDVLERELNVVPAPETSDLAGRLREAVFSLSQRSGDRDSARSRHGRDLLARLPFTGRSTEHHALASAFSQARLGETRVQVLIGEPGIGKTRLASEFLLWAAMRGADVMRGRAYEAGGRLPYYPIVDALRARLETVRDLHEVLSTIWITELCRLLPELGEHLPETPPSSPFPEAEARTRLFEAVARLGKALTARVPVVFFVDDLQWADAASLDLLAYVVQRWSAAGTPLLLLLAARSEDLDRPVGGDVGGMSIADWLAGIARDTTTAEIRLGPLTRDDVGVVLRGLLDDQPWPLVETLRAWLFEETRGQPFFLVQTLGALLERGTLRRGRTGDWELPRMPHNEPLPGGIRDLIRSRLARLSVSASLACTAVAVLGDGCDFEQVRQVASLSPSSDLSAVEEAISRGLLREQHGHLAFSHDKIREVVYGGAGETRLRLFHRRTLDVLEAHGVPAARLAHHAQAAGMREAALRHGVAAGDEALRLFAVRAAIVHYEQARTLIDAPDRRVVPLLLSLGRAYEFVSEWTAARATYLDLLDLARVQAWADVEGDALNRLATVAAQGFFDLPCALEYLAEASMVIERHGDRRRLAETEWNRAQITFYVWEVDQSLRYGLRALDLALGLADQDLEARSRNIIAYASMMVGDLPRARTEAEMARALFAARRHRAMEADCLSIIALLSTHSGENSSGIDAARAGVAIAREAENSWGEANCAHPLARGLLDRGAWGEALAVAEAGVAAARIAGHPPTLVFNLLALGAIYRAHLEVEPALQTHGEAHAIATAMRHPLLLEWSELELCADAAVVGNWPEAYVHARRALANRNYNRVYVGMTRWLETEALVRGGDQDQAAEDLRRAEAAPHPYRRLRLQVARGRAVLALSAGDAPDAVAWLRQARAVAAETGLLHDLWQIDAALVDVFRASGDASAAATHRASTAATLQTIAVCSADDPLWARFEAAAPIRRLLETATA
jgi:DNA-binding SARP family transcriptional activator